MNEPIYQQRLDKILKYVQESSADIYATDVLVSIRGEARASISALNEEMIGVDEPLPDSPCCDGECGGMTFAEYDHENGPTIRANAERAELRQRFGVEK